jgi:Holliday junction resolvase-like predicted endonuclease
MGIAKHLKAGRIIINSSEMQIEISDKGIILPYSSINDSEWGQVYEKYVGQVLEDEGYNVMYNGLEKGFLDRGVDLVARKDDQLNFIQCKYIHRTISKSKIEWILYKASGFLFDRYQNENKKLCFTLIVSNKDKCFSKRVPKKFRLNFTEASKIEYPMLQYFLDHNYIQDKIKLEFREIRMTK